MSTFLKANAAALDYSFDWSDWLAVGETITTSTVTVDTGLTLVSDSETSTVVTVWLSGGIAGQNYKVVNTIATSAGRTDQRTMIIRARER